MTKRKKYILDKHFQLRTAYSLLGFVALVSLIIIASISFSVVYNNEKISNIYEIEDSVFQLMQTANIDAGVSEEYKKTTAMLQSRHESNLSNIEMIADHNRLLLCALVLCIVFQVIILYVLIIRLTHRISGPVYVMSNYFREIINGHLPDPRPLRDNDELKNFYELFREVVQSLKDEQK